MFLPGTCCIVFVIILWAWCKLKRRLLGKNWMRLNILSITSMGINGFKEKSYIFSKKKYKNSLRQTIHWAFFFFFFKWISLKCTSLPGWPLRQRGNLSNCCHKQNVFCLTCTAQVKTDSNRLLIIMICFQKKKPKMKTGDDNAFAELWQSIGRRLSCCPSNCLP